MTGHPDAAGQATLASRHDAVLADLDGTLIWGSEAIPGASDALEAAGLPVVYATNNASKSPGAAAEHLRDLGFAARADDVMTSAQAAVVMLTEHLEPGGRVLVVGHPSFEDLAREAGYEVVHSADDDPQGVLQGLSRELTWGQLAEGCLALRRGVPWVASNVDTTLPSERGLLPGNGSLVACLVAATDREPLVAGKPAPGVFLAAAERVGSERPIVVGDRLDTDIQGGVAAGMPVLMVLTGVNSVADLVTAPEEQRPTHLAEGLGALVRPESESRIDSAPRPDVTEDGDVLVVRDTSSEGLELARGVLTELWARGLRGVTASEPGVRDRLAAAGLPVD